MDIRDKLKDLPKDPGCYMYKNKNNEIIYVGKAKNLSNRVKSYFTGSHNSKTTRLIMDIVDFEFIITSTEKEAFILEMNLIKKYHPKYNIMLMDDKMYPFIFISNEKHPKITYTRTLNLKGKYFGPFPNAKYAKEVVDMLNKLYPLRKCKTIPKKECLYYHINNCLAPCIKKVEKEEYTNIINKIVLLLNGNTKDEIKRLKEDMYKYSEALEFEKAIECQKLIKAIEETTQKQKMQTQISDADCFNYAVKDDYINIQVFQVRNMKLLERNAFTFDLIDDKEEMFKNVINQFYLMLNNPLPKEIIVPNISYEGISEEITHLLFTPKQGKKKELLDLVLVNINKELENLIIKKQKTYEQTQGAVDSLAKLLNISKANVIESYDNSNISGVSNVSAMVKYINGVKSPKDYRKYKVSENIKDDYHTFIEVLNRRFTRLIEEKEPFPDLIIMDGGKIQVNSCKEVFKQLNISIPVMGLVKDDNHKTKAIYYEDQEITIDPKSPLFKLLVNIQDEVHRYAISFHHNTHAKKIISSKLDAIKGIGKVKKQRILNVLGDKDFKDKLKTLSLSNEQIEEVLKIYNLN